MKKKNNLKRGISRGFTLIELLVVMMVILTVGTVIASILFSTLSGTDKTNTLLTVRQNGEYAIAQMSKMVRNAKSFDGIGADDSVGSISVNNCSETDISPTITPPAGGFKAIQITNFDGGQTTFVCCNTQINGTPVDVIASNSATPSQTCGANNASPLIDTTQVYLVDCSFTCTKSSFDDYPTVGISFHLDQKNQSADETHSIPPIPFETSITLRNR